VAYAWLTVLRLAVANRMSSKRRWVMPSRLWILVIAAAAVVASFGAGYAIASSNSKDYAIYTGDCYTGDK
jgi:hypothetical protein